MKWVITGQPPENPETQKDVSVISTIPGGEVPPLPLLAIQGVVRVVFMATATGSENPEKVRQEEQELVEAVRLDAVVAGIPVTEPEEVSLVTQTLSWKSTAIPVGEEKAPWTEKVEQEEVEEQEPDLISVTEPEEVSLVTQTLFWESTAIPAGVNPREMRRQPGAVAQEVALTGISMRPSEDGVLKVVATQTLFLWSTAIAPKDVTPKAEKVEEGGALPPVPPPPIPQEARERRKKRQRRR